MVQLNCDGTIPNIIAGQDAFAVGGGTLENYNPATGEVINLVTSSGARDVDAAVAAARDAYARWSALPAVARGEHLFALCQIMEAHSEELATIAAAETGKPLKDARGEVKGAIQCGRFFAGEGTRMFGRTMPSGQAGKYAMTVRQPIGVAGLIIASNTPIANVAWKIFPAMICGNAVVLKAAETAPGTALAVARLAIACGLPPGVLNVVQGNGPGAGAPLVEHEGVDVVSFTGSSAVGRQIAEVCAKQMKKVSLELGGKNPLIVCRDADIDRAVRWAALSAFSNAGQRCAAGSRILVENDVYDEFVAKLAERAQRLRLGVDDAAECGPVMSEASLNRMIAAVAAAVAGGARLLAGGQRATGGALAGGFYMQPTLVDQVARDDAMSRVELFGPVAAIYPFSGYGAALEIANDSPYGLTAAIHTKDVDRALHFAHAVSAGVAVVNAGTFGSEPHMPFGGLRHSGNGTREPGTEALDIYSNLKDIYIVTEVEGL